MLVAGVVHHQVGDDPHAALVRFIDQFHEISEIAKIRKDLHEIGDVVPAVAQRRLVQRKQPEAVDTEPLEIVQFLDETADVSGAVAVRIGETPDENLVEDGTLEPVRIARLFLVEGVRNWLR